MASDGECRVEVTATGRRAFLPLARSGLKRLKSNRGGMFVSSGSRPPGGLGGGEGPEGRPSKDLEGRRRLGSICWYLRNWSVLFVSRRSDSADRCCAWVCKSCTKGTASGAACSPCQPDLLQCQHKSQIICLLNSSVYIAYQHMRKQKVIGLTTCCAGAAVILTSETQLPRRTD